MRSLVSCGVALLVLGGVVWGQGAAQPKVAQKKVKAAPKVAVVKPQAAIGGELPVGAEGKPLNLDFETGDLRDWIADGEAFADQPIKGDSVVIRKPGSRSEHAGQFWIGGYEKHLDKPQGTLTSAPFKVTQPFASFLVGGGRANTTRVELVRRDNQEVIFKASGEDNENMRRVSVDLKEQQGKEIFIRLVDKFSGGWGHVNFDDFRFHATQPVIVAAAPQVRVVDLYKNAGLPADDAAKAMTVPAGFKVTAFAGEPDIKQPIAMTIDDRGRLWVAEAYSYPVRLPEEQANDRILIFEDNDNDGKFDKKTVFTEKLNLVSGLEVGFGGVWVGAAPHLLFIPDKNGDDKPDGPPQILLDGWGYQDTHETLNSFIWGPDGWLYGCHGVFTHSRVGKPGTPDADRIPINAGIFRYHPTKHQFEVFAHGTSNPWGVDFNDNGQCFLTCCVIPHLFHIVQGARYHRQGGVHFNPHTYADIQTIAVHRHWVGNQWQDADRARSNDIGGGHAHAGAMIYLGGKWPDQYRNQLFMNNIHGARINQDVLSERGSGYVGNAAPDFILTNDLWSQILYLRYGPDGDVYMIDWYDGQQCHLRDPKAHDRSNGRILKVSYVGTPSKPTPMASPNLRTLPDSDLVALQTHKNDWYVRTARRLLQERAAEKKLNPATHEALWKLAFNHDDITRRLRGLWALHVTGGLTEERIQKCLNEENPWIRAWAIQLAFEDQKPSAETLKQVSALARADSSQVSRLYIASAIMRLPLEKRWEILTGLLSQSADINDHNLPLMYWYAAEPLADVDASRALQLAADGNIPQVLLYMIRRVGSFGTPESLEMLVKELGESKDVPLQKTFLQGITASLKGRRQVPMPKSWPGIATNLSKSPDADVRSQVRALAVTFGDTTAFNSLRTLLSDSKGDTAARKDALSVLLAAKDKQLAGLFPALIKETELRGEAIRALAAYDEPATAGALTSQYATLSAADKRDALNTLAARANYATLLLAAVEKKQIPATDLTADLIRQLRNLKNADLDKRIGEVWGVVRDTAEDKAKLVAHYKTVVAAKPASDADLALGRAVFVKTCQQCHAMFGTGGKVGPELTGSNRANLDYLLSNVLDPSAVLAREYIPAVVATTEGRIVTGLVRGQDANAVTLVTANETVVIPRGEIEEMRQGDKSMMPDDLLKQFSEDEVRALVAYMASPRQVPLLATADNLAAFYSGKDLTNWIGDPDLWKVENGEIVGTSPGLKRNTWLASQFVAGDFRFTCEVKLTPNTGNSGIQFRSELLPDGEVKGYQADVGIGWWGKLYEEHGRALLWKDSGEAHVKQNDWNRYEIVAVGSKIKTFINGQPCVDLDDPPGAKRGIVAFQLHSGNSPFEVRYRNLKLELNPQP